MMRKCFVFFASVFFILPVLVSCTEGGKVSSEAAPAKTGEIRKESRKGPFCVRLMADKDSLSIAESVTLTIEAEVEEGYEAELPKFGEKLGDFGIRDYREDRPQLTAAGKIATRKIYTLDPFLSGDYVIAPMQVRFREKAQPAVPDGENASAGSDSKEHEIATEEITIKVNSLLEKDRKDLALNPIKGPVALPSKPLSPLYILLGLGAASLVAGTAFFLMRRRGPANGKESIPAIPAHETAYRQIRELLDEKLLERGEYKLFFSRISDVLRYYIENRFGLHAPRRTTEEFLADISRDGSFSSEHRRLLDAFLHNCDLVKFAEHLPSDEEITKTIDSCKAFIDATKARTIDEPSGRG